MALEAATLIHQLIPTNPVGSVDKKNKGDDHIRMIKDCLLNTVPNVKGPILASHTEINYLVGVTSPVQGANQKNVANGIAGLDADARILNAQNCLDSSMTTLRLSSMVAVDLASGAHALTLGDPASLNLAIGRTAVQSRLNGAPGVLFINPYGGQIDLGVNLGADAQFLRGSYTSISGSTIEPLKIANMAEAPALGASQHVALGFYNSLGNQLGWIGYNGFNLSMRNTNLGGGTNLQHVNLAGVLQQAFRSTPDGVSSVYANGLVHLNVAETGLMRYGNANGVYDEFFDLNGTRRAVLGYAGSSGPWFWLRTENPGPSNSGAFYIDGQDAGGLVRAMFYCTPNGETNLYYAGNLRLQATSAGGTLTGTWNASAMQSGGTAVSVVGHTHSIAESIPGGVLPIVNGGTGQSGSSGTGALVLHSAPYILNPTLDGTVALGTTNANALTVAGQRVTTINEFGASHAAAGYQRIAPGLLLQWGVTGAVASGGSVGVTFPTAFGTLFSVVTQMVGVSTTNGSTGWITAQSASGFTVANGGGNSASFFWMAFGV